jgi:hypothetical protein
MPDNPLFRWTTPATPTAPNPYARFGFKWNPFPDKPGVLPGGVDPRSNGSIYVEAPRMQEQRRFEELLLPRPDRTARPMAFLMDAATRKARGIGKTAFLHHQRRRIMPDFGWELTGGTHILFAAHILTPAGGDARKFWQFARVLIESLNEQDILTQLLWRVRVFTGIIPGPVLEQASDPRETIGNDQWLVQQGVDVQHELSPAVQKAFLDAGVTPEFAKELAISGHSAELFRHNFLRHQSDYRWRQNAVRWLSADLVAAFQAGRFTRGLFLIDDFEKCVLTQNSRERRSFIDSIRFTFLDGPTPAASSSFYSFLWVINPYVQELLIGDWNAAGLERFCALGGERAGMYTLDFLPLTLDATRQLVVRYLDEARLDGGQRGSLQPFDDAAIEVAFQLNTGLPGFILQHLHFAVERAIREGWPVIDAPRIRELAAKTPSDELPEPGRLRPADVDLQAGQGDPE